MTSLELVIAIGWLNHTIILRIYMRLNNLSFFILEALTIGNKTGGKSLIFKEVECKSNFCNSQIKLSSLYCVEPPLPLVKWN